MVYYSLSEKSLSILICCLVTICTTVYCYIHFVALCTLLYAVLSQSSKEYDFVEMENLINCILFLPRLVLNVLASIDFLRTQALY